MGWCVDVGWAPQNLEREIDDPEIAVGLKEEQLFPEIVTKLLYALTYDRTVKWVCPLAPVVMG